MIQRVSTGGLVGGINLAVDPTALLPSQARLLANLRIREGVLVPRGGMKTFGNAPDTKRVITLYGAVLGTSAYLIRADREKVYVYNAATGVFDSITAVAIPGATDNDVWSMSEWAGVLYLSNGVTGTYKWNAAGNIVDVTDTPPDPITVPPARWVAAGWLDRVWLAYTYESAAYAPQRLRYCARNAPALWHTTGSGTYDLTDDPYPISGCRVIGPYMVVWKGDRRGGSIVVGQPTGFADAPAAFRTFNPGSGIGCFAPRTIVPVSGDVAMFLGHDDVYMFDGASLKPVGDPIIRRVLCEYNFEAIKQAWAYYDSIEDEYHLVLPLSDASTTPSDRYTFSLRAQAWTGYEGCTYTSGASFALMDIKTWLSITGTWLDNGESWTLMGSVTGETQTVMGTDSGTVEVEDPASTIDNGSAINAVYESGDMTFHGLELPTHKLAHDDWKVLRAVVLSWRDTTANTPDLVELSTDGGATWTALTQPAIADLDGSDSLRRTFMDTMITGQQFRLRITVKQRLKLLNLEYEVGYAGHPFRS